MNAIKVLAARCFLFISSFSPILAQMNITGGCITLKVVTEYDINHVRPISGHQRDNVLYSFKSFKRVQGKARWTVPYFLLQDEIKCSFFSLEIKKLLNILNH